MTEQEIIDKLLNIKFSDETLNFRKCDVCLYHTETKWVFNESELSFLWTKNQIMNEYYICFFANNNRKESLTLPWVNTHIRNKFIVLITKVGNRGGQYKRIKNRKYKLFFLQSTVDNEGKIKITIEPNAGIEPLLNDMLLYQGMANLT